MSKAVMLSIRPKWCEKIVSGEKTIEVRKTRPKMNTPFKCYIYCTIDGIKKMPKDYIAESVERGNIIGEFTCNRIYELAPLNHAPDDVEKQACLTREEIVNYLKGTGYGWHISDFKLYDKPLPLNTFKKWSRECAYSDLGFAIPDCEKCTDSGCFVQKPPQSWLFVEELK